MTNKYMCNLFDDRCITVLSKTKEIHHCHSQMLQTGRKGVIILNVLNLCVLRTPWNFKIDEAFRRQGYTPASVQFLGNYVPNKYLKTSIAHMQFPARPKPYTSGSLLPSYFILKTLLELEHLQNKLILPLNSMKNETIPRHKDKLFCLRLRWLLWERERERDLDSIPQRVNLRLQASHQIRINQSRHSLNNSW